MKPTESEGSEEDSPDEVTDLFEADVETTEKLGDVDPRRVPSDATVGRYFSDLEVSGVLRMLDEHPSPNDLSAHPSAPALPDPNGLLDDAVRCSVRAGKRPMGAVLKSFWTQLFVAPNPLVRLISADVVPVRELGDGQVSAEPFQDELFALNHAIGLPPLPDDLLVGGSCWVEEGTPAMI